MSLCASSLLGSFRVTMVHPGFAWGKYSDTCVLVFVCRVSVVTVHATMDKTGCSQDSGSGHPAVDQVGGWGGESSFQTEGLCVSTNG